MELHLEIVNAILEDLNILLNLPITKNVTIYEAVVYISSLNISFEWEDGMVEACNSRHILLL